MCSFAHVHTKVHLFWLTGQQAENLGQTVVFGHFCIIMHTYLNTYLNFCGHSWSAAYDTNWRAATLQSNICTGLETLISVGLTPGSAREREREKKNLWGMSFTFVRQRKVASWPFPSLLRREKKAVREGKVFIREDKRTAMDGDESKEKKSESDAWDRVTPGE